jgi:LmbE family N-acetylglucosaminyl deacetylase
LAELLDEVAADTVLTFGPDGFTGHADHRTVAGWAAEAAARASRPVRVLQAVVNAEDVIRTQPINEMFDVYLDGGPPVAPDDEIALRLVLSGAELDRKVKALQHQASQTGSVFTAVGPEVFGRWVAAESFRQAPR